MLCFSVPSEFIIPIRINQNASGVCQSSLEKPPSAALLGSTVAAAAAGGMHKVEHTKVTLLHPVHNAMSLRCYRKGGGEVAATECRLSVTGWRSARSEYVCRHGRAEGMIRACERQNRWGGEREERERFVNPTSDSLIQTHTHAHVHELSGSAGEP